MQILSRPSKKPYKTIQRGYTVVSSTTLTLTVAPMKKANSFIKIKQKTGSTTDMSATAKILNDTQIEFKTQSPNNIAVACGYAKKYMRL